jgi:TetR/AcrR family transcriptional regulator, regulator of autoinduction and epiphytic fitness
MVSPLVRSAPNGAKKEDGRTLRSATTRRAVAEAYLNLVDAGDMRPTARAIAAEAGVSERAVFRHFQDMETLHSEAAVLQIQRVSHEVPQPAPSTGSLEERASLLAHRWCSLNERVTPVRRVALLHEPFSTEIARRLAWIRGLARTEIETTFATELGRRDERTRRHIVAALAAVMSWESWNEIRSRHELDVDSSISTIVSTLTAILTSFA